MGRWRRDSTQFRPTCGRALVRPLTGPTGFPYWRGVLGESLPGGFGRGPDWRCLQPVAFASLLRVARLLVPVNALSFDYGLNYK